MMPILQVERALKIILSAMKKMVALSFVFLLCACSTCKVAKQSTIREIQFGNGGGFTGAVSTYCLRADGSMCQKDRVIKKLSCDSLSAIYELAEQLPQEDYIHPGNTYSFIKIVYRDISYYYSWNRENAPNQKIVELFTKLSKQL